MDTISLTARQRKQLVSAREAAGLSQAALARKLKVSSQLINRLERGSLKTVSRPRLEKICRAIGLKLNVTIELQKV